MDITSVSVCTCLLIRRGHLKNPSIRYKSCRYLLFYDQMSGERARCQWSTSDPLYIRYHDEEWGVPVHDDRKIFEFLVLEGAQAGLSWLTVLKKRERPQKTNRRRIFNSLNDCRLDTLGRFFSVSFRFI